MEEKASRCTANSEFWKLSRLTESLWRQKSRVKWMKLGDKNTKYFQSLANNRFRRNLLGSVVVNGCLLEDSGEINDAAAVHFGNNFKEEWISRPSLGGVFNRRIPHVSATTLDGPFEEVEIFATMKECSSQRAPGPDGFKFSFVKKGWEFMKSLVLQFFSEFQTNGKLIKGINSTFVALIPKVNCLVSLKDFRPISMIGWLYKVLSKVLANRTNLAFHYWRSPICVYWG